MTMLIVIMNLGDWAPVVCSFLFLTLPVSVVTEDCPEYAEGKDSSCACSKCKPGLVCSANEICVVDPSGSCESIKWTDALWVPACDEDGSWAAKQCKGELSNGRCFCYGPEGTRLQLGWSWWKDADEMTCACSRRWYELQSVLKVSRVVSLHCSENGNYEELQCDNGVCWCVEPTSGRPVDRIYPESSMKLLPCYKEKDIGVQYLRQCESNHVARAELLKLIQAHGMKFAHFEDTFCDWDGSYGFYKLAKKLVYCTWKDGSRIDIYQGSLADILSMNCYCARDTRIFSEAKMEMQLSCHGGGSYEVMQADNGRPFCVDSDGFPTTGLGDFGTILQC